MTPSSTSEKRLIYLIGTYPSLTTTFIDREIRALRGWGVDVRIMAMRHPPAELPLSADQLAGAGGVIYLTPVVWRTFFAALLWFLLRRPRRVLGTAVYLLTRPHHGLRARLKTGVHVAEGIYAAYLVRELSFRELHAHFADRAATIALVVGRLLAVPYSLSIHAGADIYVNPVLLPEKIRAARHVATCTRYNKAHLLDVVGQDAAGKITYVPHGLELAKYRPEAHSNGRPVILSVGQLAERKGIEQLLDGCRALRERGYAFDVHIVGEGPRRPNIEGAIDRLGLGDAVTLHGALPHEAVIEQYRRATLFALPCIRTQDGDIDGIPNVLAEAMAMELPVVSTRLSAIPELVEDGVTGLLVPPGDTGALAGALAQLLDRPRLGAELGRNGRRAVLGAFDIERNIRLFAAALWPDWFAPPNGNLN
jgi:glycosyltransferase involved in cell wall biosynthesis